MQWDDSAQAGFTDGAPWIKVNPNYKKSPHKTETVHGTASETAYTLSPNPLQTKLEQQVKHFVKPI